MGYREALTDFEEAQRVAEVRRHDYRWAIGIRKTEAALLYAQAADNCETARCRLEEIVLEEMARELAPGGLIGQTEAFGA